MDTRMHPPLRQHTNTHTRAKYTNKSNAHLEDGAAREAEEQPGRQHWTEGRQDESDGGVEEREGEEEYAQPHEDLQEGQKGANVWLECWDVQGLPKSVFISCSWRLQHALEHNSRGFHPTIRNDGGARSAPVVTASRLCASCLLVPSLDHR